MQLKIFLAVTLQLLVLLVFGKFDLSKEGIQNRNGLIFILCGYLGFFSYNNAQQVFLMEKPLFFRETLNNSYTVGPYFMAKSLTESLEYFLLPLISATLVYVLAGFQNKI